MTDSDRKEPDLGDYSYLEDANLENWAWEFVRRNPHYREAWQSRKDPAAIVIPETSASPHIIARDEMNTAQTFGLLFFRRS